MGNSYKHFGQEFASWGKRVKSGYDSSGDFVASNYPPVGFGKAIPMPPLGSWVPSTTPIKLECAWSLGYLVDFGGQNFINNGSTWMTAEGFVSNPKACAKFRKTVTNWGLVTWYGGFIPMLAQFQPDLPDAVNQDIREFALKTITEKFALKTDGNESHTWVEFMENYMQCGLTASLMTNLCQLVKTNCHGVEIPKENENFPMWEFWHNAHWSVCAHARQASRAQPNECSQ